jgi:hypothetical protein
MSTQLGLDGRETSHPVRRAIPLTNRQREVLRFVRSRIDVRPIEVGRIMRDGRGTPLRLGAERHVSSDGADALKRLERRGLVERVSRGHWRAVSVSEAWARIAGAE